jgi:hypothetical protein
MAPEKEYLDKEKFLELQYNTLREEIETRQDRHFKLAAGALLIVPAVQLLPAGTNGAGANGAAGAEIALPLLIAAPLVVLSLYILYFSEHLAIMRCGRYIKEQIEPPIESPTPKITGWETWLENVPRSHEREQMIGFHLLYIPLYISAAIAAAPAGTRLLGWSAAFWLSVYGIVGVLAVLYVWIEKQAIANRRVNVEHR